MTAKRGRKRKGPEAPKDLYTAHLNFSPDRAHEAEDAEFVWRMAA